LTRKDWQVPAFADSNRGTKSSFPSLGPLLLSFDGNRLIHCFRLEFVVEIPRQIEIIGQ
jgi:hypothetical protein